MSERAATPASAAQALPASDAFAPPGTMSVSFTPPERPAAQQNEPRDMSVEPYIVSNKHGHGRLFALPTVYQH